MNRYAITGSLFPLSQILSTRPDAAAIVLGSDDYLLHPEKMARLAEFAEDGTVGAIDLLVADGRVYAEDGSDYVEGIRSGDRMILSRAITLIESNAPKHFDQAQALIQKLLPYTGKSMRVGITGVPGAGMVMLAMVLASVGLPIDGIALVAGIDRIFDMGRTTLNITGDASCAIVVSNLLRKREKRMESQRMK